MMSSDKNVVEIKELTDRTLIYQDGTKEHSFELATKTLSLRVISLSVNQGFYQSYAKDNSHQLKSIKNLIGKFKIENRGCISVIGYDNLTSSNELNVTFVEDTKEPHQKRVAEHIERLESYGIPPDGTEASSVSAELGFDAANFDFEFGHESKWWVTVYLSLEVLEEIITLVESGKQKLLTLDLNLPGFLYAQSGSRFIPHFEPEFKWYIRPNKINGGISSLESGLGIVSGIWFKGQELDLVPLSAEDPIIEVNDESLVQKEPIGQLNVESLDQINKSLTSLRDMVRNYGFILCVLVVIYLLSKL